MRSRVDLPAPLGPTTPSTSPGATVRETPARIVAAPCALCRSRAIRVPATRTVSRGRGVNRYARGTRGGGAQMTAEETVARYYAAWQTNHGDMSDVPLAED